MPEAVIVDAIRTPIGRAAKGSLKDVRADDLAAVPLKALVERNPEVDFGQTDDLMMGCEKSTAGLRSTSARSGTAARSSARTSLSDPFAARPMGVRTASTITASGMALNARRDGRPLEPRPARRA